MKQFLKKQWPYLVHLAAMAVLFLDPAVQTWAAHHTAYGMAVVALWGKLLHWAESPRS